MRIKENDDIPVNLFIHAFNSQRKKSKFKEKVETTGINKSKQIQLALQLDYQ